MRHAKTLFLTGALICALSISGCTSSLTIAPAPIKTTQASWDGNKQNSGIISVNKDGFLVTPHFIDRYQGLLARYGDRLTPKVRPDDTIGVSPEGGNFQITAQVLARFNRLNAMRKAEQGP